MLAVKNGTYLAGYLSTDVLGHADPSTYLNTSEFDYFATGLMSPRAILFPRDQNQACVPLPTAAAPTDMPTDTPTKHFLSGMGTYAPTAATMVAPTATPSAQPAAVTEKVGSSMVLYGLTEAAFTDQYRDGFKQAVALALAVQANQVTITSVTAAAATAVSARRQLAEGLLVNYEVSGLTAEKSTQVSSAIAAIAEDASSFTEKLTTALTAAGVSELPADFGVTAYKTGVNVLSSPPCDCPEEGHDIGTVGATLLDCSRYVLNADPSLNLLAGGWRCSGLLHFYCACLVSQNLCVSRLVALAD
jgi:hypothetical protein